MWHILKCPTCGTCQMFLCTLCARDIRYRYFFTSRSIGEVGESRCHSRQQLAKPFIQVIGNARKLPRVLALDIFGNWCYLRNSTRSNTTTLEYCAASSFHHLLKQFLTTWIIGRDTCQV